MRNKVRFSSINKLNSIDTNITILKETQTWDGEIVNELSNATKFLTEILNNTLDIAKLEEGKIQFNNNYETIQSVLGVALNITKANAQKKNILLETNLGPGIPHLLEFDKSRLTQVVINLTGNAIKFTPDKGRVSINITWKWKCGYNNGDCTTCEYSLAKNEKMEEFKEKEANKPVWTTKK